MYALERGRLLRRASIATRYNRGYTRRMKTAVSIPDPLFESAERFARKRGLSRSQLYADALRDYLEEHRADGVTEKLDEVYGEELGDLDPALSEVQRLSLPEEEW